MSWKILIVFRNYFLTENNASNSIQSLHYYILEGNLIWSEVFNNDISLTNQHQLHMYIYFYKILIMFRYLLVLT